MGQGPIVRARNKVRKKVGGGGGEGAEMEVAGGRGWGVKMEHSGPVRP